MFNRIYGDIALGPQAVLKLLKDSAEHSTVTPLIGKPSALEQYAFVGDARLERLRGVDSLAIRLCHRKGGFESPLIRN